MTISQNILFLFQEPLVLSASNPMIENSGLTDIHKQIYGYRESLINAVDVLSKKCGIIKIALNINLGVYIFENFNISRIVCGLHFWALN